MQSQSVMMATLQIPNLQAFNVGHVRVTVISLPIRFKQSVSASNIGSSILLQEPTNWPNFLMLIDKPVAYS
jgi:hypothetical protein